MLIPPLEQHNIKADSLSKLPALILRVIRGFYRLIKLVGVTRGLSNRHVRG